MLDASLFVGETIHEREIQLGSERHKLYFREVASADFARIRTSGDDPQKNHAAVSRLIAASLCEPDGSPAITVKQADNLKDGVRLALSVAIAEVNGIGAVVGKILPPEGMTGSGAFSSSQVSADGQSPKHSSESATPNI